MVNGCRLRASRERSVSLATATFFMYSTISSYRSAWLGGGLGVSKGAGEGGTSAPKWGHDGARGARPVPGCAGGCTGYRSATGEACVGSACYYPRTVSNKGGSGRAVRAPGYAPARLASPCKHHPWLLWSIM